MHPILAQGRLLAMYVGMWVLVGGLLGAILATQADQPWWGAALAALPLAVVYGFICLSAWYVARGMPLGATGAVRLTATTVSASVISGAGWVVVGRLWIGALASRGVLTGGARDAAVQTLIFGIGVLLYMLSIAVSYLLATFEASRAAERRALQVQVFAREAELRSLRSQVDPHFLFNSLQSISALTTADPGGARRMCLLLAEFLRESLTLGAETGITLARELKLVEGFLAVERVRFGGRLQVDISSNGAEAFIVPPLLLQPIVENAVTHGVAHVLEGGTIRIQASRRGSHLVIVVENPCDPDRPRGRGAGVGLANVRARLAALHGTEARMHTVEEGGVWRVELALPGSNE